MPPVIGLTQRVEFLPQRHERRDSLDQAWTRCLHDAGCLAVPVPNTLIHLDEWLDAVGLSGIVLTGGNDLAHLADPEHAAPERDALESALIDLCTERDLPLLGICRGLQMIVHHHGGRLSRVAGHVATPHPLRVVADGPNWFAPPDTVNSYHNWGVQPADLPDDLQPLAYAPDHTVEAIRHVNHRILGLMWHPERGPRQPADTALLQNFFNRSTSPRDLPYRGASISI